MRILIVEDEIELGKSILTYLEGEDYICEIAYDVAEAREKMMLFEYSCILLDIMLPFGSGFDLLLALKKNGRKDAIIIISAKNSVDDKIKSLSLGADDYLAKPFHLAELSARIQSAVQKKNPGNSNLISHKDLTLELSSKVVTVAGKEIEITQTEFSLLLFLLLNKNKVVSKNAISENLSGQSALYFDNFGVIYAHIKNLKNKLGVAGDYIKTIYGTGYKLN